MLLEALAIGALGIGAVEVGSHLSGDHKRRRARVPPSQAAGGTTAASIPGHMIPVPPLHSRADINAYWDAQASSEVPGMPGQLTTMAFVAPKLKAFLATIPWPDATGIWRDDNGAGGDGAPHQFTDCSGKAIGHPGYMPTRVKAMYDQGIGCDGKPLYMPSIASDPITQVEAQRQANADAAAAAAAGGGGGVDAGTVVATVAQAASSAGTIATTASAIAGAATAASSGAGAAGAVAAGVGAALACLGPTPVFALPLRIRGEAQGKHASWIVSETRTLLVDSGDRTLGVHVHRAWAEHPRVRYAVVAVEVATIDATRGAGVADTLEAFYADHAHFVIGDFDDFDTATERAEAYAEAWRLRRASIHPCPCDEIAEGV